MLLSMLALVGGFETGRLAVVRSLAPREVLVEEFERLAGDDTSIGVEAAAASRYIAELIADGDLERFELETMAAEIGTLSVNGFVELCEKIDDLYEAEEEEEAASDADLVARVSSLLPESGCFLREDYESEDAMASALEKLAAAVEDSVVAADDVCGDWELAYASSPSFHFNGGFTGVAKTTPGGAAFVGLAQRLDLAAGGSGMMRETLQPAVGDAFDVSVKTDWLLKLQMDPITRKARPILELLPRSVEYGFVFVKGDRVEKGWKTMRVLSANALVFVDDRLRIQRGTTANAWFVWRRRRQD